MDMTKKYFMVIMYRWGSTEDHSYPIGVFTTKKKAEAAGKAENEYRGGKYEYAIFVGNYDCSGCSMLKSKTVDAPIIKKLSYEKFMKRLRALKKKNGYKNEV